MTTIAQTQTQTTAEFDTALRALAVRAAERYPGEQGRIERGLLLALNGHAIPLDIGVYSVLSGTDNEVRYTVWKGHCDCADFARAPEGRCKHRWAVTLVKRAHAASTYTRIAYHAQYHASYGQAIRDTQGGVWFFADDDTLTKLTNADIPALHLHGRVDIAADQRRLDLLKGTDLSQLETRRMADL